MSRGLKLAAGLALLLVPFAFVDWAATLAALAGAAPLPLLLALLALSATAFYVGVYTIWLKRTSRQNIVIGGAAGAVPVLVGWAAVRDAAAEPAAQPRPELHHVDAAFARIADAIHAFSR